MTVKERIVRVDAYDGLFEKPRLNDPDEISAYYAELTKHEASINNESLADALTHCEDMECSEVGGILMTYADSKECAKGVYSSSNDETFAMVAAYILSRITMDESYNSLIAEVQPEMYYNTSGVLDDRGKERYIEDCAERKQAIMDMATILISETINDDECIMSIRSDIDDEEFDENESQQDVSEYDSMDDRDILVALLKETKSLKAIAFEILKVISART